MIRYLIGDATNPADIGPAIIAHVCNDVGAWGAGFTSAISRRWPEPEQYYRQHHRNVGSLLGTVQFVPVGDSALWVANMIAQHGIGRRQRRIVYPMLEECLRHVAKEAARYGAFVHMPRIGCGLAGGAWAEVEPIIARTMPDVSVTVYDLPGVTP